MSSTPSAAARAQAIAAAPWNVVGEKPQLFRGMGRSFADLWRHRELLGLLVRREVRARYKDSSLGLLWSLVRPLTQLLIYYFAIGQILGAARNVPSFAIFVFVGLTIWTLFTEIVGGGTTSIVANSGLIKKVYLPREIFPLASVGSALFTFAIQLVILLAATAVLGEFPLTPKLAIVPLAFVNLLLFATALALLLSALNVYLRDIQHLVEVVLTVLFWASPIVYAFSFVHDALHGNWLEQLYLANPITLSVLGMQQGLWTAGATIDAYNAPPDLVLRLTISALVSLVLLFIAQRVFNRLQGNFAQEL
ncbi:MAG: ABC transporter permease [Leifsonia sp.]|uniref:ABC transporter permease n=1 Tax=Leifsonia sp. TaxID=1870902 RepID=UPI003F7FF79F